MPRISKLTTRELGGTQLQGYLQDVTYSQLVSTFGQPERGGDKTQVEWYLRINGHVVTIYDWKERMSPADITNWNIGGEDGRAVHALNEVFPRHAIPSRW